MFDIHALACVCVCMCVCFSEIASETVAAIVRKSEINKLRKRVIYWWNASGVNPFAILKSGIYVIFFPDLYVIIFNACKTDYLVTRTL